MAKYEAANYERAMGPQRITFSGVPTTSHFARVLIAADYRMKRLGMGFEAAPISGLPSYLSYVSATAGGMSSSTPRWWLEPKYESVLRDAAGLAWELRGGSVKALTEQDWLTASGDRKHSGHPNRLAQLWADNMTTHYNELVQRSLSSAISAIAWNWRLSAPCW